MVNKPLQSAPATGYAFMADGVFGGPACRGAGGDRVDHAFSLPITVSDAGTGKNSGHLPGA
jgi:hypothetical protein